MIFWRGAISFLLALGVICALWAMRATTSNGWDQMMLTAYAKMQSSTWGSRAILVEIDDASLSSVGSWPWPRAKHGELISKMPSASTIVYDVAFIGETNTESDQALAAAAKQHGKVVVPLLAERNSQTFFLETLMPFRSLATVATVGHIDLPVAANDRLSTLYLKAGNANAQHPLLALAAISHTEPELPDLSGQRPWHARTARSGLWVRDYANVLVPYVDFNHVKRFSAADVLSGKVDPSVFQDRPVFVGLTSVKAAKPIRVLGAENPMFDVEIQLQAYESLRRDGLLRRGDNSMAVVFALWVFALIAAMLWLRQRAVRIALGGAALLSLFVLPLVIANSANYWLLQGFATLSGLCAAAAVAVDWAQRHYGPQLPVGAPPIDECRKVINQAFGEAPLDGNFVVVLVQLDFFDRYVTSHSHVASLTAYWRVRDLISSAFSSAPLQCVPTDNYGLLLCLHQDDMTAFEETFKQIPKRVADMAIKHGTSTAADHLTVSMGAAFGDLALLDQPELLLGNAQVAIKQVLAQGRNDANMFK